MFFPRQTACDSPNSEPSQVPRQLRMRGPIRACETARHSDCGCRLATCLLAACARIERLARTRIPVPSRSRCHANLARVGRSVRASEACGVRLQARDASARGLLSDRTAHLDSDAGAEPNHKLLMHDSPPCVKASNNFSLGASFGLRALAAPGHLLSRAPSRKPRTAASLVLAAALAALGLLRVCPGTDAQMAITNSAPTIFTLATSYIDTPTSYAITYAATYGSNIADWSTAAVSNIHRP